MLTFLDRLKAAAADPQAQLNRFLTSYRPAGRDLWFFVEGKDDLPFYGMYARAYLSDRRVDFVRCENKEGVLTALEWFTERFSPNPRAAFFVDADFDDLTGSDRNVKMRSYPFGFVTDGYSVESYFCNSHVVKTWFAEALSMAGEPQVCQEVANEYDRHSAAFYEAIRQVMSWLIAIRKRRGKANFNNVDSQDLVVAAAEGTADWRPLTRAALRHYLSIRTGVAVDDQPSDDQIDAEADLTREMPVERWLRGKQAIWFVARFCNMATSYCKSAGVETRVRAALPEKKNVIEGLLPYVTPPESLVTFLAKLRLPTDPA